MDSRITESIKEFSKHVLKEFSVKMIVLYGSYANGTQTENSDIDVAIIVDEFDGDILKANSRLFALVREIDVRIEPIILELKYDKSGFIDSILKKGKIIYSMN